MSEKAVDPITLTVIWNTLLSIAEELGFTRAEANSLRAQYRDQLAVFQRS